MHFVLLAAALPLALASNGLTPRSFLAPRQGGDAFVPSTGSIVFDCATPCGADQCLDVPRGDTCCAEGCECTYRGLVVIGNMDSSIANDLFLQMAVQEEVSV